MIIAGSSSFPALLRFFPFPVGRDRTPFIGDADARALNTPRNDRHRRVCSPRLRLYLIPFFPLPFSSFSISLSFCRLAVSRLSMYPYDHTVRKMIGRPALKCDPSDYYSCRVPLRTIFSLLRRKDLYEVIHFSVGIIIILHISR